MSKRYFCLPAFFLITRQRFAKKPFGWLAAAFLLLNPFISQAQEYPRKEIDLDRFIQETFPVPDEDFNYEDVYEALLQRYTTPLDLNAADREELSSLFLLTPLQVEAFLRYRETAGPLLSLYELQAVPGFDLPTIYKLLPFVAVRAAGADNRSLWERLRTEPNHYWLVRYDQTLEAKKGYSSLDSGETGSRYAGSPGRLYARYRIAHSQDFSLGFTLEKDAGEAIAWNPNYRQYGFDFMSFHALLRNRGRWKSLALGDYQFQTGQGLVFAGGFGVGKGAEPVATVRRSSLGLRPYSSVLESGYLRGAAATYQVGQFELTALASHVRRDANVTSQLDSLDTEPEVLVSSLQTTGFHRTPTELRAKGRVGESSLGTSLQYASATGRWQLGFNGLLTQYSQNLQRRDEPYSRYEFRGNRNYVTSLYGSYGWRNFNLFGELARSRSGGLGGVAGVIGNLAAGVEIALLLRRYNPDFHSPTANAFGENSRTINERGMYWGIKISPIRKLTLAAYYDRFAFPWLRYQVDAPSAGYEWLGRLTWRPTKTVSLYGQFREENKARNQAENTTPLNYLAVGRKRNWQLNLDAALTPHFSLQSRVQGSTYSQEGPTMQGIMVLQDAAARVGNWRFTGRVVLFETDDYANRQYAYEPDVLYAVSIPAYSGRGIRTMGLVQYALSRKLDIWLRYARTSLRDANTIGSGLEEINGPQRTEVKVQVRYQFL